MNKEIEQQLNKITDGLKQELLMAKAIDEKGNAIDVKKFNQIIDEKIAQCNKVLETTERDGVTVDRYGANIAFNRIAILERAKEHGMLNPENAWVSREERKEAELNKPDAFKEGIKKLWKKMTGKFKTSNSNNR